MHMLANPSTLSPPEHKPMLIIVVRGEIAQSARNFLRAIFNEQQQRSMVRDS
jgi:hypothetical protein